MKKKINATNYFTDIFLFVFTLQKSCYMASFKSKIGDKQTATCIFRMYRIYKTT